MHHSAQKRNTPSHQALRVDVVAAAKDGARASSSHWPVVVEQPRVLLVRKDSRQQRILQPAQQAATGVQSGGQGVALTGKA